ncbi:MAG: hypothetical protein IPN43_11510 [Chitinophagaceae bacterium]|nr:hypothetical protein [Chitinophagaceae bacterium]
MSPAINGLVQTSNNLARVLVKDGEISILCLTRSSVDSEKWIFQKPSVTISKMAGARPSLVVRTVGWAPRPGSTHRKTDGGSV